MNERVEMAAALGDESARQLVPSPPLLPEHHRSKLEMALAVLGHREAIRFAIECAGRVLPAWESVYPGDRRPASAVAAASLWMTGDCTADDLATAAANAETAGHEADDPQLVPADDSRTFAVRACSVASHIALTAESAARDGSEVASCAAWAATFARKAVDNPDAEERWQLKRLSEYLMRRC